MCTNIVQISIRHNYMICECICWHIHKIGSGIPLFYKIVNNKFNKICKFVCVTMKCYMRVIV